MRKRHSLAFVCIAAAFVAFIIVSSAEGRGGRRTGRERITVPENNDEWGDTLELAVDIAFSGEYGQTITDETGTRYCFAGQVFYENKVYPPEYWGVFPMYFEGTQVGVGIDVENASESRKADVLVRNECYCLRTDGGNGAALMTPTTDSVDIDRGAALSIDGSFIAVAVPGMESGLDRFTVEVFGLDDSTSADITYTTVETHNDGQLVRFSDPTTCLGEDGANQTDTFTVELSTVVMPVTVTTKAGTEEATSVLDSNGASVVDDLGFQVTLASIVGNTYTITVRSVANTRAMSHVDLAFPGAVVTTTDSYRTLRLDHSSLVSDKEGVFCPPESEGEILDAINLVLGE